MVEHHGQRWLAGGASWEALASLPVGDAEVLQRPVLLKLEGDTFMEQLTALLALPAADRKAPLLAGRISGPLPPSPSTKGPRLYQPVHGHYTMVLASLVCELPGLPEHAVGARDQVGFVVRKLGAGAEWAYLAPPAGSVDAGSWVKLTDAGQYYEKDGKAEELHGLFPVRWTDGSRSRKAWAGVVPVGGRERYEAGTAGVLPTTSPPSTWQTELDYGFLSTIQQLNTSNISDAEGYTPSALALYDLGAMILRLLGNNALSGPAPTALSTTTIPLDVGTTPLWSALSLVQANKQSLLQTGGWNGMPHYQLKKISATQLGLSNPDASGTLRAALRSFFLAKGFSAAEPTTSTPGLPTVNLSGGSHYIIRCIYRRPPCGTRSTSIVSLPTIAYRMAGFLELDAPQRPTRISIPTPSAENLRKIRHSVGMVMSAATRKKTEGASTKDTLDGKKGKEPNVGIGWITLWSIPIITICAMILLMIIATLLNLVFWWLPLLRITIPVVTVEEDE